ncbi:unnamed protein product, partial [Scytosiphon promiscuus]
EAFGAWRNKVRLRSFFFLRAESGASALSIRVQPCPRAMWKSAKSCSDGGKRDHEANSRDGNRRHGCQQSGVNGALGTPGRLEIGGTCIAHAPRQSKIETLPPPCGTNFLLHHAVYGRYPPSTGAFSTSARPWYTFFCRDRRVCPAFVGYRSRGTSSLDTTRLSAGSRPGGPRPPCPSAYPRPRSLPTPAGALFPQPQHAPQ